MTSAGIPIRPVIGKRYPLKLGRSLRTRPGEAREHFALKFAHIPERIAKEKPGVIRRDVDKVSIHMEQDDGSGMKFTGLRKEQTESAVRECIMVFEGDTIWLERVTERFYNVKPSDTGKTACEPPHVPTEPPHGIQDPDSWDYNGPDNGSPITPPDQHEIAERNGDAFMDGSDDEDAVEIDEDDVRRPNGVVNGVRAEKGLGAQNMPSKGKMVVAGRKAAQKSVGGKMPSRVARNRKDDDDEDDGSSSSSSSDDSDSSSEESGDSSDNDSDRFTDGSSDSD